MTTLVLPKVDLAKCSGCGECVVGCPTRAVELVGGHAVIVRPADCSYCAECEGRCPEGAIACPFEIVFEEVR